MARKVLQSRDVKVEFGAGETKSAKRGPVTGMAQLGDLAFIGRFGTPEEFKVFRQSIEARQAKTGESGWQSIPGLGKIPANKVLGLCVKCGHGNWHDPDYAAGGNCLYCNLMNRVDGGKLRTATKKETAAWLKKKQEDLDRWLAAAPDRAKRVVEFNRRAHEDGKF
jgi:hypothetical protein